MKLFAAFIFTVLTSTFVMAQTAKGPVMAKPFESDNCTFFPDGNYADCCVAHDKDYYYGGSLKERSASDRRLKACVMAKGKGWKRKLLANAIWLGVRVGGVHFLPTAFRWGFGNKWPRKEPPEPKPKTPMEPH